MNVAQAIQHAEHIKQISDTPLKDIQLILSYILNISLPRVIAYPEYQLNDSQQKTFYSLLKLRQQAMPMAYILHTANFWSLDLYVDNNCLIPRPETEILVEQVIQQHHHKGTKLLDLGTGSGAISIAIASERKSWDITAVDNSCKALEVAKTNALTHKLHNILFMHSNWFSGVSDKFDIIVANPPYIAADDEHLPNLQYEPQAALVADNNGLADLEHIISNSKNYLSPGGYLYLEHGFDQEKQVTHMLEKNNFLDVTTLADLDKNPRISYATIPS